MKWKGYNDPTWEPVLYIRDTLAYSQYLKLQRDAKRQKIGCNRACGENEIDDTAFSNTAKANSPSSASGPAVQQTEAAGPQKEGDPEILARLLPASAQDSTPIPTLRSKSSSHTTDASEESNGLADLKALEHEATAPCHFSPLIIYAGSNPCIELESREINLVEPLYASTTSVISHSSAAVMSDAQRAELTNESSFNQSQGEEAHSGFSHPPSQAHGQMVPNETWANTCDAIQGPFAAAPMISCAGSPSATIVPDGATGTQVRPLERQELKGRRVLVPRHIFPR